jgi:hypothetical protein
MTSLRMLEHPARHASFAQRTSWCCSLLVVFLISVAAAGHAQNLNWEGQTGALVTPFAYTSPSPAKALGLPAVSFHYLDGGSVLGGFYEVSGTVGFLKRFEAGYTRAQNSDGSVSGLSPLFNGGFNIFHGKANLLGENAGKHNYIPAISLGFVARTNVQRVGGVLNNKDTHNEDFYIVATKTIPYFKRLPIVASLGFKATNGSVLGIAGNAANWQGRLFGAAGFVVPGPVKSRLVFGSEFLQEPRRIEGLPGSRLPTTLTYFARVIPRSELPLNIDFGVAQVANQIAPGVKLHARSQFALGVSYRF